MRDGLTTRTGAGAIAEVLAAAGVTRAFGIPGGEVLALVEALEAEAITFHLARHETAAGFLAEGHWHATGSLPVLVTTLGPGVTNAATAIAHAAQDRVPLIVLTGCVDADVAESFTHQVFDHQAFLRPIVKASLRAAPGATGAVIAKAIAIATDAQPGPVHVDVPIGVAEGPAAEPATPRPPRVGAGAAEAALTADAARLLAAAERPLAIAGLDAVLEDAGPAVTAFCRAEGIPLVTSYKGKGLLDEDDPLALGGAGLSPNANSILMPLVRDADCLLLVGYDPIEMRAGWRHPWPANRTVIEIAPIPRTHGMHAVSHRLQGAIAPTLAGLAAPVPRHRWPGGEPAAARAALRSAFSPEGGFGPAAIFHALRAALPPETVATADSGAHRILFSQIWRCPAPRQLLQSTGLCTMACALPLATGYRLGRAAPVLAVLGDGGLEMGLGELATLRDLRVPLLVVVLVDASLELIAMKQRAAGRPAAGTDLGRSDLPAIAAAMGGSGRWVDNLDSLRAEAAAALAREGFTLLACRIDRRAYDGLI